MSSSRPKRTPPRPASAPRRPSPLVSALAWLLTPLPAHPELYGFDLVALAVAGARAVPCPSCRAPAREPCGEDQKGGAFFCTSRRLAAAATPISDLIRDAEQAGLSDPSAPRLGSSTPSDAGVCLTFFGGDDNG